MSRPSALAEASRPLAAAHETLPVTIYLACRYEPAWRRAGFGAILVSGPHTKSVSGTLDASSAPEAGLRAVGAVLGHLHRPETCLVAIVTNAVALAQQIASTQDALNTRKPVVRQVRALIARCAQCVVVYRPLRTNGLGQADALAAAAVAPVPRVDAPARGLTRLPMGDPVINTHAEDGAMRVISGGQTGADQAGLEAARACGLRTGGTAPSNFWTENGPDPSLSEFGLLASGSLKDRTKRNVLDADATIVFMLTVTPGSVLTLRLCAAHDRPALTVNPWDSEAILHVVAFLRTHRPRTLNVAGHRESKAPGVHDRVLGVLTAAFRAYLGGPDAS